MDDFVRGHNSTIVEHLKTYDFDVSMSLGFPFEKLIMKKMGLPGVSWLTYFPDPIFSVATRAPWDLSTSLPTLIPSYNVFKATGGHKGLPGRAVMQ